MSQEAFLRNLACALEAAPREEVETVQRWYVYHGKRHPNLAAVAHAKGLTDDPKYFDVDNTLETGAVSLDDAVLLHTMVRVFHPQTILEIGTWFGTSAGVMASATACMVRTCDRNDVYCVGGPGGEHISYRNCPSTRFLKVWALRKRRADFAFVDANLKGADGPLMRRVLEPGSPIALHDFEAGKKGERNYQALRHYFKELELVRPDAMPIKGTSLALMVPRGTP